MKLVVDTNIIFSLFKSDSFTRRLIKENNLQLFAPEEIVEELRKYSDEICRKAKIEKKKFLEDIILLNKIIEFKKPSEISLEFAKDLISDKADEVFLALAIELKIPIWSNDNHLKEQTSIKVFTTPELACFFGY
jgi:predicted nucleic acid-binding protein